MSETSDEIMRKLRADATALVSSYSERSGQVLTPEQFYGAVDQIVRAFSFLAKPA